jgi:hypothetical protein
MNKQNDTDLSGVITSILVLFCAVILLFGMYSILVAIA